MSLRQHILRTLESGKFQRSHRIMTGMPATRNTFAKAYSSSWKWLHLPLRYFTWDKSHFPTPIKMQEGLAAHGRKLVNIIDPHIKKDEGYYVYKQAKENGFFTLDKDGKEFDGWAICAQKESCDALSPVWQVLEELLFQSTNPSWLSPCDLSFVSISWSTRL